jgi:hypothetical protein
VSLTIISKAPRSRVRIGGEYDKGCKLGFVLLACSPSPCLLTRRAARDVARALVRFAESARSPSRKNLGNRFVPFSEGRVSRPHARRMKPAEQLKGDKPVRTKTTQARTSKLAAAASLMGVAHGS